ncbi:hypothetical protein OAH12_00185 [Cyclobacteriaceae bacterium]|nr:hypothetical protein [Cyclobacteriaceae bacterium]
MSDDAPLNKWLFLLTICFSLLTITPAFSQLPQGSYYWVQTLSSNMHNTQGDSTQLIRKHYYNFQDSLVELNIISYYAYSKGDTVISPADGGHFFYKGTHKQLSPNEFLLSLTMTSCEYCLTRRDTEGKPIIETKKEILKFKGGNYFIDNKQLVTVSK